MKPGLSRSFTLLTDAFVPLRIVLFLLGGGLIVVLGCTSTRESLSHRELSPAHLTEVQQADNSMQKASEAFKHGAFAEVILNSKKAAELFEEEGRRAKQCEALILMSKAYQAIAHYEKAIKVLETAMALARATGDRSLMASVLDQLGNTSIALNSPDEAYRYLTEAQKLANALPQKVLLMSVLNNLGNLFTVKGKFTEAINSYKKSFSLAKKSKNHGLAGVALVNAAMAAIRKTTYKEAKAFLDDSFAEIMQAQDSHQKAYCLINIGLSYYRIYTHQFEKKHFLISLAFRAINNAVDVATNLNDSLAKSYALGYLGKMYEEANQWQEAMDLTRMAIFAAQEVNSLESLYRWEWQVGRLFKTAGKIDDAVEAYRRSISALQSIRQEMSNCYGTSQSSFRGKAGPVYFEFVDLLLQKAATLNRQSDYEPYLVEARNSVEKLKVFELQEYFQDDCIGEIQSKVTSLDEMSKTAVVIYPIILKDRLELLVSLPSGLERFTVPVTREELVNNVRALRTFLEKRTTREYLPYAKKVYSWVIRPLSATLKTSKVDTLVFVPDGCLRTIPMAALHDGKHFLVENYATAITPGLDMSNPRPLERDSLKTLAAGLAQPRLGFPRLPYVVSEVHSICKLYSAEGLIDKDFTIPRIQKELASKQFNVVHIASHGFFGKSKEDTFLLAYDGKLTMDRLRDFVGLFRFRDTPLELLTLSACQTAAGDDRAALGLAGIAIRSGARSALATLWSVNDFAASELVSEFYKQLRNPSVSRAVALQRAQLKLLHERGKDHPAYWSPFLLINNWL